MSLSNIDLSSLCKYYMLPLVSVSMKDELPKKVVDGNYFINLESSTQGSGSHWLFLAIHGKNSFYFDSFGVVPPTEVRTFVKRRRQSHLGFNNSIIQDLRSENCGYFCFALLMYLERKGVDALAPHTNLYELANEYIELFHKDTLKNDAVLGRVLLAMCQQYQKPIHKLICRLCREKRKNVV